MSSTEFWRRLEGKIHMTVQTKAPESQFAYVVLAARRARQIMAGAPPMVENLRTQKATRIACEEVNHGLIEYEFNEVMASEEEKDGAKRRK
jgi:DNA-directed RNA polymerase omega subunit